MSNLIETTEFPAVKSLIADFFNEPLFSRNGFMAITPAANLIENGNQYKIDVAAPGLKKEDFKVTLDDHTLRISAEKEEKKETKDDNYTRMEYNYNTFTRSFLLPDAAKDENIEAAYKDGILEVVIPKREEAKQNQKNISVK